MLAPGAWVRVVAHGHPVVGQVIGVVKPGQHVAEVVGQDRLRLLDRGCNQDWRRPTFRVALLVHDGLRSRQTIVLCYQGNVLDGQLLESPPPPRRVIPTGSEVHWGWHTRSGWASYRARVVAFIPAFSSLQKIAGVTRPTIHDVSRQDRYLVEPLPIRGSRLLCPAAYVLEEALEGSTCAP